MKRQDIGRNQRGAVFADDGSDDVVEYGVDVLNDVYEVTVNCEDKSITLMVNGEEAALSHEQSRYLRELLAR